MIHFLRYFLVGGFMAAFAAGVATTFGERLSDALWTVANAVNF